MAENTPPTPTSSHKTPPSHDITTNSPNTIPKSNSAPPYVPPPIASRPRKPPRLLPAQPPVCEQTERYRDQRLDILRSKPEVESADIGRARHLRKGDRWDQELGKWVADPGFVAKKVVVLPVKVGMRERLKRAVRKVIARIRRVRELK